MKYCPNCGEKLKENADVCLSCGVLLQKKSLDKKVKIPGKGISISGMIIGIVSILIVLGTLSEIFDGEFLYQYYNKIEIYVDIFSYASISITGLILSIIGCVKQKSGFNISGIILNSISVISNIILFVYIILCF